MNTSTGIYTDNQNEAIIYNNLKIDLKTKDIATFFFKTGIASFVRDLTETELESAVKVSDFYKKIESDRQEAIKKETDQDLLDAMI